MNDVCLIFGRFQGLTVGHELLIKSMIDYKKPNTNYVVVVSTSKKPSLKDPLTFSDRKQLLYNIMLKLNFKFEILSYDKCLFSMISDLCAAGVKRITIFLGGDRFTELDKRIKKYIGLHDDKMNFSGIESIELINVGDRSDDDDGNLCGVSATKLRSFVMGADYNSFCKLSPPSFNHDDNFLMYNMLGGSLCKY